MPNMVQCLVMLLALKTFFDASQMFHDNGTTPEVKKFRLPLTGFTHTYTPNDFKITDHDVMQRLGTCFKRLFKLHSLILTLGHFQSTNASYVVLTNKYLL